MVADFMTPIAPTGWLELDGSVLSTTTYAGLYAVVTIQKTGTRVGGTAIISGISSTTGMKAGYFIFGTGITAGTTILTVDSANQVTMSANAGSSGTSTITVSPWALGSGTFTLPNMTSQGKYRRSRTSGLEMGANHVDQNKTHTHTGTTNLGGIDHTHFGVTGLDSVDHHHDYFGPPAFQGGTFTGGGGTGWGGSAVIAQTSGIGTQAHTHSFTTGTASAVDHTHAFTTSSNGGTEARPTSYVYITCVKT